MSLSLTQIVDAASADNEFSMVMPSDDIYYANLTNERLTDVIATIADAVRGKSDATHTHADKADLVNGTIPASQLPSYVDDVLEYTALANFPTAGETGKIYVDQTTNKTYRWSGSAYVEISASLALGETASTAYRGDRGATAYSHSQNGDLHVTATQKAAWDAKSNFSGSYNDLSDKPTIPSAYTHPASHPASMITGLADVATSGSYNDLSDKPTIPTVPTSLPANGGNADTVDNKHASDFATANHVHSYNDLTNKPTIPSISGLATETYVDESVSTKANSSHSHDDRYYTETEIDTKLASKADSSHNHTGVYDVNGAAASALTSANAYTDTKINALVGEGASTTLDTIGEIASAIEENQDAIDLLNSAIGVKANASNLTSHTSNTSNPHAVTKAQVGLGNVPNVATNDQTPTYSDTTTFATLTSGEKLSVAFAKVKLAISNLISHIANKANPHGVTKSQIGLGNVDNTSDANKPISTATQTALDGKSDTSHSHDGRYYTESEIDTKLAGKANSSHTHTIANVTNLQSILDGKASSSHTHSAATTSEPGLMSASDKSKLDGIATGATKITVDSALSSSSTNPVQNKVINTALAGKAASSHTHTLSAITGLLGLLATDDDGDVKVSWSDQDVVAKIKALGSGIHTAYAKGGTTNNPKTTESWRFIVHKTGTTNYGWVIAFGSSGSIYTGYVDNASWKGWKCLYNATSNDMILWSGSAYMQSTNSTPQVVTPSKKLSQCRTGWMLLWSDYDPGDGANDSDFCTTFIPKYTPSGGTWGGKAFYCDIPMYVGSDATDLSTEKRCIKPVYVHDDCLKGSYQNTSGGRNDVVLRAVYEV